MSQVRRLYVEKKPGFDGEAQALCRDLRHQLGLKGLTGVRILVRYDVAGMEEDDYAKACVSIFSEPMVDQIFHEELPEGMGQAFAREYLPGQYDQRADSAAQCVQLLTQGARPQVRVATVYGLTGELTGDQLEAVKGYLINPVDSCQGPMEKFDTLDMVLDTPEDVKVMEGFTQLSRQEMAKLREEMGLAMSLEDALFVAAYFARQGRDPFLTEIRVIDTYWSDHCRHTTFLTRLEDVDFEESPYLHRVKGVWQSYNQAREALYAGRMDEKYLCLMDLATIGAKLLKRRGLLDDLDESEEINACSIRCEIEVDGKKEPWLIMFKNETHNHPTEIEPFGGAATCLGGAIRDPLSGRSYVYQAMRVTGSADPRAHLKDTLPGKLPQRKITQGAAAGYSSYGNQIGLATGQVVEIYHPGYAAKRLEIGAVVGAAPAGNVVRETPAPGDVVVLLGGRTGRDGCGGATGSSKAHTAASIDTCGAEVQKGNPLTERKLQRLFRNPDASRRIKRCNDFGAGGVCVAVGELAPGLDIDLDKVPRKYEGLDGTELAISESQERMAVVLDPKDVEAFMQLAAQENLEATVVATVTDRARMRMTWRGKVLVDLERAFLDTNGVTQVANARVTAPEGNYFDGKPVEDVRAKWLEILGSLNGSSQRGLAERFDASIGAGTVLMPFAGKYQHTPTQAMAAKLPVLKGQTTAGTLMAFGFDPYLSSWSPFHGAVYAVVESMARIACAGGDVRRVRLTFQEYFERLNQAPERWGKPLAALLGAYYAQDKLGAPSIGGKDSMSGSFEDMDVPPTLVSFALAPADMKHVISGELKAAGDRLALLRLPRDEEELPDFDRFLANCEALTQAITEGRVVAAHTVAAGGLAETVARMGFGNMLGAKLEVSAEELFAYQPGCIVVELKAGAALAEAEIIGSVTEERILAAAGARLDLQEALETFEGVFEGVFPIRKGEEQEAIESRLYTGRNERRPAAKLARPRVLIPVFPGTNCEYDTVRAFERAGAQCQVVVVRNTVPSDIPETVEALEAAVRQAQIVMLPGGFSGGDEPDGSGKFIATTLRNPRIMDAIHELLNNRDGLMLGICNGFQALIKLGLVPYGRIQDMTGSAPTLTFNKIGRHQSRIVRTKVTSTLSPWMAGVEAGDVISVAISHGEGRFVCSEEEFRTLLDHGQIATQYVDGKGEPTWNIDFNPNGSFHAVEGITSPDGRVLGKMGHNERSTHLAYKNVPGNYDSQIFESGVKYFL